MTYEALTQVLVDTALGLVLLGIDEINAPLSAGVFLEHVDQGTLTGSAVYRIVTEANQSPEVVHRIEVIQWGLVFGERAALPPVEHEPTSVTNLRHERGTLSMARQEVGTAGGAYFFCLGGDLASLDEGGGRQPDGQGFAAFGQVLEGWDVLEAIFARAEGSDRLQTRIPVLSVRRA